MAENAKGGRPRKGTLEMRGKTWHARMTVTVDGESIRPWFDLGTDNKAVARRKMARLLKEQKATDAPTIEALAEFAKEPETVAEATARIVERQGREGLKTWRERLSRLARYALPELGKLAIARVRPSNVRDVLTASGAAGLSKQSVQHLRNDLNGVFGDLWRDEQITENPVARVKLPKGLAVDARPRVILSDSEFAELMACPHITEQVRLMSLASRCFGGMRTSDLHAWDWAHVDTDAWQSAEVYRPKTDGPEAPVELVRLELPEILQAPLRAWWKGQRRDSEAEGARTGPVFPVLKGERAGERHGKRSHARELRAALWRAGVHRPLAGFSEALQALRQAERSLASAGKSERRQARAERLAAELAARALDAIQTDTPRSRAADFHSFRRAFNTALGAAGVNVQQAMALAGHKDARTHMLYVQLAQRGTLTTPAAALPTIGVLPL
ncbi:MAG TPA: tyrosine-type recombinase/integrase, partial [Polyangiaceae bacterium]|nr:tyrosine-type recombinase/integrase [Polyangiaceae bacterium]